MTIVVSEETNTALNKAKISLMSRPDSAFFTTLCFSMWHKWSDQVETAACNGKQILWNPTFFMNLQGIEERVFLLLHETMHAAYLHMDPIRMNGRCPDRWNIACDHVINLQLVERGFTMPTGINKGNADPKYKGMSAEEVYALLPNNPGKPSMQDLIALLDGMTPEELQSDIEDILVRAQIQSKMANDKPGTIPGEIELFLDKLLNPKLPWHRILQKYVQNFAKNDYSFRKPNRRFFPKHYLPSMFSETLMDLAIAIDVSGSVSDADFMRFVTEIYSILRMMKPSKITLIQFDSSIKLVNQIYNILDLMKTKFTGRGGTDINPVLDWANKNKPQLLLVFSDGEFYFNQTDTKVNTIWLINNRKNFTAPWGKVIHYEM